MGTKYVYSFNEGNKDMKSLLGGKGEKARASYF